MLKIINAYENNLKNISVNIPLNKIVSIVGVSGSGKSTLIYDVIANEAKRREKIDSGNATCFDFAIRAKFDEIQNLPYAITLKQRGIGGSISSTIATYVGLHELLRDEFSKDGKIFTPDNQEIKEPTIEEIIKYIKKYHKVYTLFAIVSFENYTDGKNELKILNDFNVKEAIFISSYDKKERLKKISSVKTLNPKYHHTILVEIKLQDISNYKELAKKSFLLRTKDKEINFYYDYPDIESGKIYQKIVPELFSFNSISQISGKCDTCNGKGKIEDIDWANLINKNTLDEKFLNFEDNGKGCYKYVAICFDTLRKDLKKQKINVDKTFYELDSSQQNYIKNIIKEKIIKHQAKPSIGKFVKTIKCPECKGTRLNYKANAVKLYDKNISEYLGLSIDEIYEFLKDKELHHKKIIDILKALKNATLGYLTLDRTTDTLSGGELQRLKFAVELIGEYKNLLYILDEPSNGLHPYNNYQMIELIKSLRDKGNSVIISEHNIEYIKNSDYVIELGYGSGVDGGEIVFSGEKIEDNNKSFDREKRKIDLKNSITFENINVNNIQNENFTIPLNSLVAITGISGSGKSSFIHKAIVPCVKSYLKIQEWDTTVVKNIKNIEKINDIVELTQSQIGNNTRSIVATYLNVFDEIREIFASLEEAKELGFDKSYFSFNNNFGACNECKGMGIIADGVICHSCLGDRYKPEILEVRLNDLNIMEVLNLTIDEFKILNLDNKKLQNTITFLQKVGLGHLTFSRITPTLSGGEAQRLKLVKVLIESIIKIEKGNLLFIFDEPTTGLNAKDIEKLYSIFNEILDFKNTIIIIEHNLEIIKNSDFIIDIGVGSGIEGGKNIFSGSYEELLQNKISLTAKAFRGEFEKAYKLSINDNLKEKQYNFDKSKYDCNPRYLDDSHFLEEKQKAKNYKVITDDKNHIYFKTKDKLFNFVNGLENFEIFFNPFVSDLYKYKIVPLSIKKERIKNLKKLKFKVGIKDYLCDEWDYRVKIDDLQKAYSYGKGWITVKAKSEKFELFTRVVSIKDKIIGSSKIDEKTFNLYLNSCIYCNANEKLYAYDKTLLIKDESKSILEKGFLQFDLKLNLKTIIKKFKDEELFDFTKPYNRLTIMEKDIFLFGFKEYEFLKKGGRINAKGDYIRWEGLYRYIFDNINKIDIADKIIQSKHFEVCPFCKKSFKDFIK